MCIYIYIYTHVCIYIYICIHIYIYIYVYIYIYIYTYGILQLFIIHVVLYEQYGVRHGVEFFVDFVLLLCYGMIKCSTLHYDILYHVAICYSILCITHYVISQYMLILTCHSIICFCMLHKCSATDSAASFSSMEAERCDEATDRLESQEQYQ